MGGRTTIWSREVPRDTTAGDPRGHSMIYEEGRVLMRSVLRGSVFKRVGFRRVGFRRVYSCKSGSKQP